MKTFNQYLLENTNIPLKTFKKTIIKRSKFGVGKDIGGSIYVHKNYAEEIIPKNIFSKALMHLANEFEFNTIKYDIVLRTVRFDSAKNFNSAREPWAGEFIEINPNGNIRKGSTDFIWHHKWLWVKDDYTGFDVQEAYNWSKLWLSKLQTSPSGSLSVWKNQLYEVGLK